MRSKQPIKNLLVRLKTPVEIRDLESYKRLTIRINHKGVSVRDTELGVNIGTKNQFRVRAGDFILSKIDARQGAFGIVPPEADGGIITGNFWTYRVDNRLADTEWFLQFTNGDDFLDLCKRSSTGNTHRKYLNEAIFLNHEIVIPSLGEQRKVVAACNLGRERGEEIQDQISVQRVLVNNLKQAILQEAIQGKLTSDWRIAHPEVESVSYLLQSIQVEKDRLIATKKLRPEKPQPVMIAAEIPFDIPSGWGWHPLASIMICRDGERNPISKTERERRQKVFPYYGASGIIDKIDGFTHNGRFLLVGEDGSNLRLRSTPIAFEAVGKIWVNNHAHVLEFVEPVLQQFVSYRLNGMDISPFVTGGFQPKLSQENMNRIPIPLPPLAELAVIVERVEALMTTCNSLESEIEHSRTHAASLLQAVLKEAFSVAS